MGRSELSIGVDADRSQAARAHLARLSAPPGALVVGPGDADRAAERRAALVRARRGVAAPLRRTPEEVTAAAPRPAAPVALAVAGGAPFASSNCVPTCPPRATESAPEDESGGGPSLVDHFVAPLISGGKKPWRRDPEAVDTVLSLEASARSAAAGQVVSWAEPSPGHLVHDVGLTTRDETAVTPTLELPRHRLRPRPATTRIEPGDDSPLGLEDRIMWDRLESLATLVGPLDIDFGPSADSRSAPPVVDDRHPGEEEEDFDEEVEDEEDELDDDLEDEDDDEIDDDYDDEEDLDEDLDDEIEDLDVEEDDDLEDDDLDDLDDDEEELEEEP